MGIHFNYYYGKDAEQFSFYRIPKLLFTDKRFARLSSDAKILYGILLDRMSLSMRNNWVDSENKVYIIFTIDEIAEIMCCGTQKATKTLQELDNVKGIGLVEKKRLGLGKPNILYIKNFVFEDSDKEDDKYRKDQELLKSQKKNDENHNSVNVKTTKQEWLKSQCNNTDINNTDYSNTDIKNPTPISPTAYKMDSHSFISDDEVKVEGVREIIKQNIKYPALIKEQPEEKDRIDLMLCVMGDAICNKANIKINKVEVDYEKVKERFLTVRKEHIEYALGYLRKCNKKIGNLRAYLTSLIYNAPINSVGAGINDRGVEIADYSNDEQIWQSFLSGT